jgi:hypothetical protein
VFVSLKRLETRDMTIATIIQQITKCSGGTQLMMLPYNMGDGDMLPQLPSFCANGLAEGELMDDAVFAARCEQLFMTPEQNRFFHPSTKSQHNDDREYPKDIAADIMRGV